MKKSGRKLLGILLTASIIAATVFPMQGTAAEGIDREVKSKTQQEKENATQGEMPETTVSANILPTEEMGDSLIMPMSYDVNQPVIESFEFEENGQTLTKDNTLHFNMSAYDADRDIRTVRVKIVRKSGSSNTQQVTLQKGEGNLYTGTLPCSRFTGYEGDYYISQVYVEDETNNYVEWPVTENGQYLYTFTVNNTRTLSLSDFQIQKNPSGADGKLRVGDTVTYTAHVECEGMEPTNTVYLYLKTVNSSSSHSDNIYMKYNAETKTLTGTYTIKDGTYPAEWTLDYIYTYLYNKSYYFYPNKIEPNKDLKFTVSNDDYDAEKPIIESITIDKNGQMVKAGEKVTIKVKVKEKNPNSSMRIRFYPQAGGSYNYTYLYLDKDTMEYTGSINITSSTYPTKWELDYLSLSDVNGNSTSLSDFQADWNTTRPWYYTVDPDGYRPANVDTKSPVIESITIDKNGEWVYPGDTVTITIKVDEENPYDTAYADFYPQVTNVSSSNRVYLRYNADTKEYKGTISITDNTYPCEWMLTDVQVRDNRGNYTYLSNFKPDWRDTCPWYYRVETDKTYREDVQDATFTVYGLMRQEDGSYSYGTYISGKTMKVGRRDSLEGIGVCPPLPAEGVGVKFQDESSGREIDGDTELFFANSTNPCYSFRAVYDKSCVNVVLTYVSKEEGMKMAIVPQFVDKGATYGEMLASFVPPADVDQDLLTGYQLDGSRDETAIVEDLGYVGVEAKYNDCVVAWSMKYLDENGKEVSRVVSKAYEKGTTMNDALAVLEQPKAPEGLVFEKWILPGINGEETLFHEMTNLNIIAAYKGRTTAEVSYTYRGEDGKLASGSSLMALEGENLSYNDTLVKVKEELEALHHLEGLVLSDWARSAGGTDIAGYKKMSLQAQYANCTVILKYPKDACEYVVVDKGSSYMLPVENKEYMDIVWEGYGMGETVVISEDKEFLLADAKRKDGTTEEPSGGKLSGEEIEKIVADIEQSGSGETLRVDMKKATVVPKEVLEAIKGKEVNIVLDMGDYSWSIGGDKVVASDLKDIDLEVIVGADDIPSTVVEDLADGKPATQIKLIYDGEFGFQADLTVNLGSENSGCTGNLYYYDSAGKLVFQNAGEIGADGNISLSFSHASEYVVIIDKELTDSGNETDEGNKEESGNSTSHSGQDSGSEEIVSIAKAESDIVPSVDVEKDNDSGKPKSPKTGE